MTTRDELLAMARGAGISESQFMPGYIHATMADIERFHALAVAPYKEDADIGAAIRMAAKDLPENFEVEITVERGAASVYLRTPDAETFCIDVDSDNRLAAEIRSAIDRARSAK